MNIKLAIFGPYPPPIGGISLFIKKLNLFINKRFETEVFIINEFGSHKENKSIYNLSSNSKIVYLFRLLYYLFFINTSKYIYYHGVHGVTRFILVIFSKILKYEVIFHFHGKSVIHFHKKNWLSKMISSFYLQRAKKLIAVNDDIINKLKSFIPSLKIENIPAYLPSFESNSNNKIENFINKLDSEKKYYLSYGTLDKAKNGKYNYGITDLLNFFNRKTIREGQISLILVVILYKKENFEEFNKNLSTLLEKENSNIKVFINQGGTQLIPFFKYVEGYIRWTHEDGLGVSLIEALDYGISAIATNVCKRPKGVKIFDINKPAELESYILKPNKNKVEHKRVDYQKMYIELFEGLNFQLKERY